MPRSLAAISSGAVFMGANTYIGNAPNFMVYAIARDMGVRMPSFFGYMLWSGTVLLPDLWADDADFLPVTGPRAGLLRARAIIPYNT